jgi:hypothetical protein
MTNKGLELARLKSFLENSNLDYFEINGIIEEASESIDEALDELIQVALEDVLSYADSMGAYDFLEDIYVRDNGFYKEISSTTGSFFFSKPEVKNLPNLLKGGKTAKDGTQYKVIPVGKPNLTSSIDAMRAKQSVQQEVRKNLNSSVLEDRANQIGDRFRQRIEDRMQKRRERMANQNEFRTATSKQDSNESWVIPKRDFDLTEYVDNINSDLAQSSELVIINIVDSYIAEL